MSGAVKSRLPYGARSSRRREAKMLTRRRLQDAACALILRSGEHAATIERIVAEAGVGRGTFYLHFRSREEVLDSLRTDMLAKLDSRYDAFAALPSADANACKTWLESLLEVCRVERMVVLALGRLGFGLNFDAKGYYDSIIARLATGRPVFAEAQRDTRLKARAILILMQVEGLIRYFSLEVDTPEASACIDTLAQELSSFIAFPV